MNIQLVAVPLVSVSLFVFVAFLLVRRRQRVDAIKLWSALLWAWAAVLVIGFVFEGLPFSAADIGVAVPLIAGVTMLLLWTVTPRLSPGTPRTYLLVLGLMGLSLGVVGVLARASGAM